jgi:tetrahydrodipicolinate N-succinyltransferase
MNMALAAAHSGDLQTTIEAAWDARDTLNTSTKGAVRDAVDEALNLLDSGKDASPKKTAVNGRSING